MKKARDEKKVLEARQKKKKTEEKWKHGKKEWRKERNEGWLGFTKESINSFHSVSQVLFSICESGEMRFDNQFLIQLWGSVAITIVID